MRAQTSQLGENKSRLIEATVPLEIKLQTGWREGRGGLRAGRMLFESLARLINTQDRVTGSTAVFGSRFE